MRMDKSTPAVSVIVPVRNLAEYVEETVLDLLGQSFRDFELILIDGQSTDGTVEILKKLAEKDRRIDLYSYGPSGKIEEAIAVPYLAGIGQFRTIHGQNGVSAARNFGLRRAKGRYVVFPDGDDRIDRNYLECLLKAISTTSNTPKKVKGFRRMQVQLGMTGYTEISDEGKTLFQTPESGTRVLDKDDLLCRLLCTARDYSEEGAAAHKVPQEGPFPEPVLYPVLLNDESCLWNKILRRDNIEKYHIQFDEGLDRYAELLFLVDYVRRISAARMSAERPYHYRIHDTTVMGNPPKRNISTKMLFREISGIEALAKIRKLLRRSSDARWFCEQNLCYHTLIAYNHLEQAGGGRQKAAAAFRKWARLASHLPYEGFSDKDEVSLWHRMRRFGIWGRLP